MKIIILRLNLYYSDIEVLKNKDHNRILFYSKLSLNFYLMADACMSVSIINPQFVRESDMSTVLCKYNSAIL